MFRKRRRRQILLIVACMLVLPLAALWTVLLHQTDLQRVERLRNASLPRNRAAPPASSSTSTPPASDVSLNSPEPVSAMSVDFEALIAEAKTHHQAYPESVKKKPAWEDLTETERAEIDQLLTSSDAWADQLDTGRDALLHAFPEQVLVMESPHAPECLVNTRLKYQIESGRLEQAAKSFLTLLYLAQGYRSLPSNYHAFEFVHGLPRWNQWFHTLQEKRTCSVSELQALVDMLGQDPNWSLAEDLVWLRREYAVVFQEWAKLSPTEAIETHGVAGLSDWLWRSPALRPLFNRDVDLFMSNMDRLIACAEQPWWESTDTLVAIMAESEALPGTYPANANWLPLVLGDFKASFGNQAAVDLLRLGLAVEMHHLDTGSYPATLDPLEKYFPEGLPQDPFSGHPYKFNVDNGKITVSTPGPEHPEIKPLPLAWHSHPESATKE